MVDLYHTLLCLFCYVFLFPDPLSSLWPFVGEKFTHILCLFINLHTDVWGKKLCYMFIQPLASPSRDSSLSLGCYKHRTSASAILSLTLSSEGVTPVMVNRLWAWDWVTSQFSQVTLITLEPGPKTVAVSQCWLWHFVRVNIKLKGLILNIFKQKALCEDVVHQTPQLLEAGQICTVLCGKDSKQNSFLFNLKSLRISITVKRKIQSSCSLCIQLAKPNALHYSTSYLLISLWLQPAWMTSHHPYLLIRVSGPLLCAPFSLPT